MDNISVSDRLTFLAEKFDVFEGGTDDESYHLLDKKVKELEGEGYKSKIIYSPHSLIKTNGLAIVSLKMNNKERVLKKISVSSDVFTEMLLADPTENKVCLQWMLSLFVSLIKEGSKTSIETAIRLVVEDLPQAKSYLKLFEDNKRKNKFKVLCGSSYILKGIEDPTNINQYKSLSQLFDAVDPFIEKEPSVVERMLNRFVEAGQAVIPVKDRRFTLYIPKTTEASVIFEKYANWCTAKQGNSMFNSYINNNKKPNGKKSDIYIIIDNDFFIGKSKEVYQIHFETNQLKDRNNGQNVSIFENVLSKSTGIANYFKEELMGMAKDYNKGIESNKYLDYLIQFGFAESLFELLEADTPTIRYSDKEIPRLPDMSKFKLLDTLILINANLTSIPQSIGTLTKLEMLVLPKNKIKTIPKEIGNLKNLTFLNLSENPIVEFPEEIKYLDRSHGGSLLRIGIKEKHIGEQNMKRLKELLPTTSISDISS